MQVKKAIITAAGFGSRFLPITKSVPKEMLPIIDKPIIQILVEECAEAGIEEVIVVAGASDIAIFEDYFYGRATYIRTLMIHQHKLERWHKVERIFELPLVITVIPQDESLPYGNGRPVLSAKDILINEEAFLLMFGDDLVLSQESAAKQLIDAFVNDPCDALLAVQTAPESELSRLGVIKLKEGSDIQVESAVEKPAPGEAPSNLVSYGRYILTPRIFDYLRADGVGKDGELWLQDANNKLAHAGRVCCHKITGEWMTTGDPLRYLKSHIKFALQDPELSADIKDFVRGLQVD